MNDQSPSAYRVMQVVALAQATLDSLREDQGLVLETEAELRAALADEGVSVDALLSQIGRAALDAAADVEAANDRLAALCARRDRAAKRAERLRDTLLQAMLAIGLKKHPDPEFDAWVSPGKAKVIVTDPAALNGCFMREEVVRTPDKALIKAALALAPVTGATLSNPAPFLTLKVR